MASPPSQPHSTFLLQRQQSFAVRDPNTTTNTTAMNQLDEGYSEEMRSQSDGDTSLAGMEDVPVRSLDCVQAVMGLPPKERHRELPSFTNLTSSFTCTPSTPTPPPSAHCFTDNTQHSSHQQYLQAAFTVPHPLTHSERPQRPSLRSSAPSKTASRRMCADKSKP